MLPHDVAVFSGSVTSSVFNFIHHSDSTVPLIKQVFSLENYNTTFKAQFRELLAWVFGDARDATILSPSQRYSKLLEFTYPVLSQDKFWLISNGLTEVY